MKLIDLLESVTIQGDVHLSVWDEAGEQLAFTTIDGVCDYLCEYDLERAKKTTTREGYNKRIPKPSKWVDYSILYIFTLNDGYLHIELSKE